MGNENEVSVKITLINEINDEVKAIRANIEKQFSAVNDKVKESQRAFAGLGNEIKGSFVGAIRGAIVAYAGFEVINKITGFLMLARQEVKESVQAQMQLKAALGFSSAALVEQADILGKKLLIDDSEILGAQAMLANYIKEEGAIKKLIPAILDLSAAKGINLVSAADMMGRAISGNSDEMARLGISFGGAKTEIERADAALRSIKGKFEGQAAAIAQSKDLIDKISLSWKQLAENVGYALNLMNKTEEKYYNEAKERIKTHFNESDLRYIINYEKRREADKKKADIDRAEELRIKLQIQKEEELKKAQESRMKTVLENAKRNQEQNEALKAQSEEMAGGESYKNPGFTDEYYAKIELDKQYESETTARMNRMYQYDVQVKEEMKRANHEYYKQIFEFEKQRDLLEARNRESALRGTVDNLRTMASKWKEFGAIYKAAAISETIIDTYAGAQAAFKSLAGIPIVGPILGTAAAAAAVGAGIARVSEISAQQFAMGTASAPGGRSLVGEYGPEYIDLPRGSTVYNNSQTQHIANTNNNGHTLVYNHYDNTGTLSESIAVELRSGRGDRLINMLAQRMGVN
jgi:hypothetical protein